MMIAGRRYDTGEHVLIEIVDQHIGRIRPCPAAADRRAYVPWVAPALVDLQVNGHGGQEFTDPNLTPGHVHAISSAQAAHGITRYLPTLTTHAFDTLHAAMVAIAQACEQNAATAARVAGIHLEGPYISSEDGPRGAHPKEHCRPPNWDEFQRLQDAAGGRIVLLTMSPEYPEAITFIERAAAGGVLISIGHTAASAEQIRAAVDAGARMSTHLGNAAHGQIRRHPNYIWEQLAEDRLVASLIVDGHHLPASVVKSFVRAKTPQRCVLVSDITGLGGMPPGRYETGLCAVEILDDGRMVIAGQRQLLAGAALPITYGVANVMRFAGVDLQTAMEMSSIRPAQLIGAAPARLESGSRADLIVFNLPQDEVSPIQILATIESGRVEFGRLDSNTVNA